MYFCILGEVFKNGSPGQATMLARRASKFCVEPRSPFSNISRQDSKNRRKTCKYIFLAWMLTWVSKWQRRRRRRRRPNNSPHLAKPLDHHAQDPNIPFRRNPSLRLRYVTANQVQYFWRNITSRRSWKGPVFMQGTVSTDRPLAMNLCQDCIGGYVPGAQKKWTSGPWEHKYPRVQPLP